MIRKSVSKIKSSIGEPLLDFIFSCLMTRANRKGRTPFGTAELKLLYRALLSQNLCCINGKMVPALEKKFAHAYGVPYAVASTSGTAAIHVALGALDLNPGDEVITAPITDLGTIIPILYQNAIPVFADIDGTYNMDPKEVESKISARTRAIIAVHLFGNPCDMDAMAEIARRHNIPLIEDCSQAHMTKYKGQYVGTIGDIGCFSFQQSKHMTTGDGGMTITANKNYYERMKLFADKGYARQGWGARAYLFHAPNYRMTELVGAVGLAQLDKVRAVVEKRAELGQLMTELLTDVPGITPAPVTPGAEHSYWLYPLRVEDQDIQDFTKEMSRAKVFVLPGYTGKPIYLCSESLTAKKTYGDSQCPFACQHSTGTYEYKEGLCPQAEQALQKLVCIVWDESWTSREVSKVAGIIKKAVKESNRNRATNSQSALDKVMDRSNARSRGDKIRVGIIGCGQIGRWHLESYKKDARCEIVACVDSDIERAERFANEAGAKAYRSHKEMIEREHIDGVSICTVPATHRDIALDLLENGIHVLCEKPLAISVGQAEEMYQKAKEKNLFLLTAFKFRFYDEVLKAKELIAKGSLGKIVSFRLMFGGYLNMEGSWYSRREHSGGGVIMDNGPHAVDLVRYLFGEVDTVVTEASRHQSIDVEDTAKILFRLNSGAVGVVDLSWSMAVPAKTYLEIYGEDGAAHLDSEGISYKFKTWNEWKRISNGCNVKEAFARQVSYFIGALTGQEATVLGNGEGLNAQRIIEALYRSGQRSSSVSLLESRI